MVSARTTSDGVFDAVNSVFLTVVLMAVSYPLLFVVSASFSDPAALLSGQVWLLPVRPSLNGYQAVLQSSKVWIGYANSLFYLVAGTAVNVGITLLAAYALSRKDFTPRRVIMFLFIFTMFFDGGLIPTYLVVRSLGLINMRAALIIPAAISIWNLIVARTFIEHTIPDELVDAARMDGCNHSRFLMSVVIPLSTAMIAVIALFYGVAHWNEFFEALLYLNDESKFPLQIFLRQILLQNQVDSEMMAGVDPEAQAAREYLSELLRYALIIVGSLPVLLIYPFAQKYFVKGVMIGAIKG